MTIAILALLMCADTSPEPPLSNAEATKKLQRAWEVVALEYDGKPIGADQDASTVVIEKDRLVIRGAGRRELYTFKLDAKGKPPRIDLTFDRPQSRASPGIFKFDGDKLTIVSGGAGEPRPAKFDGKAGTKFVLRKAKVSGAR